MVNAMHWKSLITVLIVYDNVWRYIRLGVGIALVSINFFFAYLLAMRALSVASRGYSYY